MSRLSTELLIEPSIVRDNILQLKSQIENKSNFMAIIKSDACIILQSTIISLIKISYMNNF